MVKKYWAKKGISKFDLAIYFILGMLALITIFPFYNVVLISFASSNAISKANLYILPHSFDLSSYKLVFANNQFWNALMVTVFITVAGVAISMIMSTTGAYALSKKGLPGRNWILTGILFTMFFNGGLIPYYLVIKSLGLVNNIMVMIIPSAINTMYLIIMKNYFSTIPASLEESARIDGADDIYILFKIILPISAPFIATFGLFYAVERWNEWWYALVFINESSKVPMQIFLRELLILFSNALTYAAQRQAMDKVGGNVYIPSLQMAAVVLSCIPILLVYPFLQKHFVRGILVGSIKE